MLTRTKAELNKIASLDNGFIRLGANYATNNSKYFIINLNPAEIDYICHKKPSTELDADLAVNVTAGLNVADITLRKTNLLYRTNNAHIELLVDGNNNLYGFNARYNALLKKDRVYDIRTAGRDMPLHFTIENSSEHIVIMPIHLAFTDVSMLLAREGLTC